MLRDALPPAASDAQLSLRMGESIVIEGTVSARGFFGISVIVAVALLGSAAIVLAARSRTV